MEFDELLAQVIALLQRQGRVSYRALKRQFKLDDDYLEDLKVELIEAQRLAADEQGRVLVWLGSPAAAPLPPHRPSATLSKRRSPTRHPISPRRFSPPAPPWKASASRSPCCLPTSKAPWS